jgi:uncharacterized protein
MLERPDILGKGWSYPPAFSLAAQQPKMAAEAEDVEQSLKILLSTRPGELLMEPRFGCNLDVLLFEPLTTSLVTHVKELIQNAILYYEPRIELQKIAIDGSRTANGIILIELDYFIRSYNSRFNLVFPLYMEEGSNVEL